MSANLCFFCLFRQVNEAVLRKVIEYCEHHRNDPLTGNEEESESRKKTTDIEEWDQKFMQVDQEMLFEIILVRTPVFFFRLDLPMLADITNPYSSRP